MKSLVFLVFVAFGPWFVIGCGGVSERAPAALQAIEWDRGRGLTIELPEPVEAGALVELGQVVQGPGLLVLGPITIDGVAIGGVELEFVGVADGAAFVSRFGTASALDAGTVIGSTITQDTDASLVQPVRAWLAADGVELASRNW